MFVSGDHPKFEELRRLLPAVLLSMAAHLLILQFLPYSARPHAGSSHDSVLTVTLERREGGIPAQPRPDARISRAALMAGDASAQTQPVQAGFSLLGSPAADRPSASKTAQAPLENDSAATVDPPAETQAQRSSVDPGYGELRSEAEPELQQAALPLLDYYYTSREVDEPARAVGDGFLQYPQDALRLRISGAVKLRLFIDEFGTLVRSEVVNAHPRDIFNGAAREAVHTMSFLPARKGGQPVRSQRTVEITFDPDPAALRGLGSTRGR